MSDGPALALALILLAASLGAAVARLRWLPEAAVAGGGALLLVAAGAISPSASRHALSDLAPTLGFLGALLLLAEGCRRAGLFEAVGDLMARRAAGRPQRLLAVVFVVATAVTAVLSLDATVVLLTPLVFATASRLRISAKPHIYACAHLANSASLLLPVSNLTNLLAFHASGLSFTRFAGLMALPTAVAVGVEWVVFRRFFATDLHRPHGARPAPADARPLPRPALAVLTLTLVGFALSSVVGIAPVWIAVAAAIAITLPALVQSATTPAVLARAVEPTFLVFVAGLGVIVATASDRGLASAVQAVVPGDDTLPALLALAAIAAVLANLVNNLPATLILLPAATALGPTAVLAVLVGVNLGPNLTYVGSLATLLWRRLLHREDADVRVGEFIRLGALTVPPGLVCAVVALWIGSRTLGT